MRRDVSKPFCGIFVLDVLVVVSLVWAVVCFFRCNYSNGRPFLWGILYNDCITNTFLTVTVYFIARLSFSIHFRWSKVVFYSLLFSFLLRELYICSRQYMLGNGELVGSFGNTGLLGGFLSICICIIGPLIINNRSYVLLLLLLPVLLVVLIAFSRASWLCIAVVSFLLCMERESIRTFICSWKIPLLLIVCAMAIFVYSLKKESADSRLFMTLVVLRYIPQTGLFGAGPGNYCGFYGRALYDYFLCNKCGFSDSSISCLEILAQRKIEVGIPDYSYNESIRLLTETGFVGVAIITVVTIVTFLRLYKRRDPLSYGYLALIIFSQFSFPSTVPLFCCLFAFFVAAGTSIENEDSAGGIYPHLIICTMLSVAAFCIGTNKKETDLVNKEFMYMHDSYELGFYDDVCRIGESLYERGYASDFFMLEYGTSLCRNGDYVNCIRVLSHGMEMSASPTFWKVMGDNSFNVGDYTLAEKHYLHSFIMAPNRMQPLLDLARLYFATGQSEKLLCISNCSAKMIPKVENEKTKKMREEISALQSAVR